MQNDMFFLFLSFKRYINVVLKKIRRHTEDCSFCFKIGDKQTGYFGSKTYDLSWNWLPVWSHVICFVYDTANGERPFYQQTSFI